MTDTINDIRQLLIEEAADARRREILAEMERLAEIRGRELLEQKLAEREKRPFWKSLSDYVI